MATRRRLLLAAAAAALAPPRAAAQCVNTAGDANCATYTGGALVSGGTLSHCEHGLKTGLVVADVCAKACGRCGTLLEADGDASCFTSTYTVGQPFFANCCQVALNLPAGSPLACTTADCTTQVPTRNQKPQLDRPQEICLTKSVALQVLGQPAARGPVGDVLPGRGTVPRRGLRPRQVRRQRLRGHLPLRARLARSGRRVGARRRRGLPLLVGTCKQSPPQLDLFSSLAAAVREMVPCRALQRDAVHGGHVCGRPPKLSEACV